MLYVYYNSLREGPVGSWNICALMVNVLCTGIGQLYMPLVRMGLIDVQLLNWFI